MTTLPDAAPAQKYEGPYDPDLKKAGELASPTWELELFLSGAFVFATFQLPGLIESAFQRLDPHAVGSASFVLMIGALYGKAIAFTLIAMFSVHLGLRAYWVALMGLRSVFPGGIRWDELRMGPIAREVYAARVGNISRAIERIDNVCSIIFSVGLLIVLLFISSTLLLGVFGGVSYLLAQAFSGGRGVDNYLAGLALVLVVLPLGATIWDRRFGAGYAAGSRGHRTLRRILRISFAMNPVRAMGPMMWTLMSNVGRRKSSVFLFAALTVLIALATADRLANSDRLSVNSYDFFGASRTRAVSYRFYESQREEGKPYPRIPSIQSDIIKDPYVRLFIPYYPRRHNAAVAKSCPGLAPLQARGVQVGADTDLPDSLAAPVLDCLARLHAIKLDGAPLADPRLAFYEQPTTGLRGMITYIPVDSLAHGRHTIEVMPVPPEELPTDTAALRAAAWTKPYIIPFWR